MKLLVLMIICSLYASHTSSQTENELLNDKLIRKHFTKKDIQNLSNILNFFEHYVKLDCDSNISINKCYVFYCQRLKTRADFGSLNIGFTHEEEMKFLETLNKYTFNKIWYYTFSYKLNKNKKVYYYPKTIEMSYKSAFMNLCKDISIENPKLKFYFENYQSIGTMNSELINLVLTKYDKFDFTRASERLLLAVHYMTVNSRKFK